MKPNRTPAPGSAARVPTPGRRNPPQRILVVDDDLVIRQLETAVLIHHGYQVDAAEDGGAGWNALHASHYDLLITDNNMPNVSGIELVNRVRSARMALPVIMATGAPPEEVNLQPRLLDAMLLKPFTSHELLEAVTRVLCATGDAVAPIEPRPSTGTSRPRRSQSVLP